MSEQDRDRLRKLIVTGDNRLKQGGARQAAKARESFLAALAHAEQTDLADERVRGLLERRITDALAIESSGDAEMSAERPSAGGFLVLWCGVE